MSKPFVLLDLVIFLSAGTLDEVSRTILLEILACPPHDVVVLTARRELVNICWWQTFVPRFVLLGPFSLFHFLFVFLA